MSKPSARRINSRSNRRILLPLAGAVLMAFGAVAPGLALGVPVAGGDAANSGRKPTEQDLLLAAFRYLKLSRNQLGYLRLLAQQADRRRAALEAEHRPAPRPQDPQPDPEPTVSKLGRRGVQVEAPDAEVNRRAEIAGILGKEGALPLTRILTREQIALAWRLAQGNPPAYAQTDPSLLDFNAGFFGSARGVLGVGNAVYLRGEVLDLSTGLGGLDGLVTFGLGESPVVLGRRALTPQIVGGLVFDSRGSQEKPFPQLVVEAREPSELTFAVEPLAQRIFSSDQIVPAIRMALSGESGAFAFGRADLQTANPRRVRSYELERGFRELTGQGPALEPLGGEIRQGLYHFAPGQGVRLANTGVTSQYALQFTFLHDKEGGYQKLVDFKHGAKDTGLYLHQGKLEFYQHAVGGVPRPGQEHRVRIERNRSTRIVRGFLDMVPVFAFLDLDDQAVFSKGKSLLFLDDRSTKTEQGPGSMRSVAIWGAPAGS